MSKRRVSMLAGIALLALAGQAEAQSACENMRVNVRNSLFEIFGLDAFCAEFDTLKADVASMKKALSDARAENALLRARLAAQASGAGAVEVDRHAPYVQAANRAKE